MKKKIVYLSAFLSPLRSGAEAMVEEVAVRLPDDMDVIIVTGRYKRSWKRDDVLGKRVRVLRVGVGSSFDKYLFPFLAPFAVLRLRPDIIHAVLESYAGLALILCRFLIPRAKRILTLQSTNTGFLLGPIHRSAQIITAISKFLQDRAKTFGRTDVTLIPNGIDLTAIRESCSFHAKDSGRILFVGRLEQMKGVDTMLHAFSKAIKGLDPAIHLRIVGSGSLLKMLQNLARDLDIDHRVTFAGHVYGRAVFDEYAQAEIFCALSRSEALGNVFLEAQASRCCVLSTKVGGIPEIIEDGVSGKLVAPDDIDAAASALRELLRDPALRARLSSEAKRNAEQYDWTPIAARYAALYA